MVSKCGWAPAAWYSWTHPSPALSLISSATAPNLWPSPQLPALPPSRPPHLLPPGWKGRVCKYERLQLPDPYLQTHLSTHLPSCLISDKVPFLLGRRRFSFMSWSHCYPPSGGLCITRHPHALSLPVRPAPEPSYTLPILKQHSPLTTIPPISLFFKKTCMSHFHYS